MNQQQPPLARGNYVSEWFGHRVFPVVATDANALQDQMRQRCPFLTQFLGRETQCVKPAASLGICTINSLSEGQRKDWLVCPYRALDRGLMDSASRRLFGVTDNDALAIIPAPNLADPTARTEFVSSVQQGATGVVFLQDKLGGEISITPTERSPELSFDITLVQVLSVDNTLAFGRYGIMEVQTMDFHGSYRAAVNNLLDALRLHGTTFHGALSANAHWLSERIEGPNIANVFKRTFYQIMLKFQIGADESCAGCILAIPTSVWDSWQRHLGRPDLDELADGTFVLRGLGDTRARPSAWIYLFDIDTEGQSPKSLALRRVIATDADAMNHYALKVAPAAAVAGAGAADRVLASIRRRVMAWWPELGSGPVVLPPLQ